MISSSAWRMLFTNYTSQFPVFLVCLGATILILIRWNQASRASIWALMGFGLGALICVVVPLAQFGVQQWLMQNSGSSYISRSYIFTALSFFWASLRAISYGLLLVAVLVGRTGAQTSSYARNQLSGNMM